jgi:general secretion pathway protein G
MVREVPGFETTVETSQEASNMFMRKSKSGFTLVEILIVVIILGILAAIVIPQFTNASQDARKSSLVSQLQTLRSQIQLFRLQHGEVLPALIGGVDTVGSVDVTNWDPFTGVSAYGGKNFGPYMQAAPKNPLNNFGKVVQGSDGVSPAGSACGFVYDYGTGGDGTGRIWGTDTDGLVIYVE